MRWVRIEDNEQAWELMLAGLLWFGEPDRGGRMWLYKTSPVEETTAKARWMTVKFDGSGASLPNYIQVDD